MIRVEIYRYGHDERQAMAEANGSELRIEQRQRVLDPSKPGLGLPSGRRLENAYENPEEWVRGLKVSYRSPDLDVRVIHDDAPLEPSEQAPIRISSR